MRRLALVLIAVSLSVPPLAAQTSNARLVRAVDLIEKSDANGLRGLLKEEPSLVRRTDAGVLSHWQWTLLHVAMARDGSLDIVSALMHGAAARGSAEIVSVLLEHGADAAVRDARGLTALQVAEQGRFTEVAGVLRAVTPAASVAAPPANTPAAPSSASPPPPGGGVVQGRVLWNGQPVPGAIAYVADDFKPGSVRYGTATTDEQGRFVLTGVPAGSKFIVVNGNQRVFWVTGGTSFTMTAAPFTRDFHLCKGFDPVSPAPGETVGARPVFRWEPYPDAVRYTAV